MNPDWHNFDFYLPILYQIIFNGSLSNPNVYDRRFTITFFCHIDQNYYNMIAFSGATL